MTYFAFGSLPSLELAAVGTEGQSLTSVGCWWLLRDVVASVCREAACFSSLKWELWRNPRGKAVQSILVCLTDLPFFTSYFALGFFPLSLLLLQPVYRIHCE